MMKRRLIRRAIAKILTSWIFFLGLAVGLALAFIEGTRLKEGPLLAALLGGACLSVLATWIGLRMLYSLVARINGGPFRKGDTVEILVGPHRGRTGQVYEEWKERNEVRVDLGAEAANRCEDVFGHVQLVRAKNLEPTDREPSSE